MRSGACCLRRDWAGVSGRSPRQVRVTGLRRLRTSRRPPSGFRTGPHSKRHAAIVADHSRLTNSARRSSTCESLNRSRQAGRGGALRRRLRAAHQRPGDAAAGGVALPRSVAGRRPVPRQGDPPHPPDLSFLGCRHPRPCVLFVSRPDAVEGAGRSVPASRASSSNGPTRDLDCLQEAIIEKDAKRITTRTAVAGQIGSVFQAASVALPPNLREQAT
jgi:hypothetical protein